MQYRRFGRTNEQVSAMGFGTWPMSGDRYGAIEIDEAVKAIQAAIDAGVNCVDTAPAYGSGYSETAVARALKGRRDKVLMLADGNAAYTRALGLELDASGFGMGQRSQRFAIVVDDGIVKQLHVEAPREFKVSSAEHVLKSL